MRQNTAVSFFLMIVVAYGAWITLNKQSGVVSRSVVYATSPRTTTVIVPGSYDQMITQAANNHGIDPLLLTALVKQESGFNPNAISRAGAMGLGQLMPGTARDLGVTDPFDPAQNLDGAARYLSTMIAKYSDLSLALAAYNAGPGAVSGCMCIPQNGETPRYVTSVLGYYKQLTQ